ncbi:MAG: hypothetical protein FWD14_01405 [Treponema sp.]|nr:hypothetical protein [Treponema sp.]
MNRAAKLKIIFLLIMFILCLNNIFCEQDIIREENENENEQESISRTFFLPAFSYKYVSFDNLKMHNISSGATMLRFNPADREKMFLITMMYSPQITSEIDPAYPDLYHNVSLTVMQMLNKHMFYGSLMAMTEKPLYGGSNSYMSMAGYSYNIIKGDHFSMNLGTVLLFMDIGYKMDNGMPWFIWPLPMINLSWTYEWIEAGFIPGARMTLFPKAPVSFTTRLITDGYDFFLQYNTEKVISTFGFKREMCNVNISDGGRYGIKYYALYGGLKVFKFLDLSGGWAFNGEEEYKKRSWDSLFSSFGYSRSSSFTAAAGNGYFFSASFRLGM